MLARIEFQKKTRALAFERAGGKCEHCHAKIGAGMGAEYDHIIPAMLGGDNSLENCQVLCVKCHKLKTKIDVERISKACRTAEKNAGIRKKRTIMSGGKNSKYKRKFNGEVILR